MSTLADDDVRLREPWRMLLALTDPQKAGRMLDPELALAAEAQLRFDYSHPLDLGVEGDSAGCNSDRETVLEGSRRLRVLRRHNHSPADRRAPHTDPRIYMPHDTLQPGGANVFFHGGGFMVGNLNVEHYRCLKWAKDTKTMVVSCDYRLNPENRYPAAPEDCAGCFQWVAARAKPAVAPAAATAAQ